MEPDFANIIQAKISALDHQPAHWDKQSAWMTVSAGLGNERQKPVYYPVGIAASLMIFALVVWYVLLAGKSTLAPRIDALQAGIEKLYKSQTLRACEPPEECVDKYPQFNKPVAQQTYRRPLTLMPETIQRESIPETTVPPPEENSVPAVIAQETVPAVKVVEAIVGYIPQGQELTIVSHKARKSKVRLIRVPGSELSRLPTQEAKWIVARIN